jgi:ATP-dependent DNA helicase RecQ
MSTIAFIDSEIDPKTGEISDLGAILIDETHEIEHFHGKSIQEFEKVIEKADFICGHNIFEHDLKYIGEDKLKDKSFIDTLFWSPLLFPKDMYHNLSKDEKLLEDEPNNPLNDSKKARILFDRECSTFKNLDSDLKNILYFLLCKKQKFKDLFKYFEKADDIKISEDVIIQKIQNFKICKNAPINEFIKEYPVELAYSLALIKAGASVTPRWVWETFPKIETILKKMRNTPCKEKCDYCSERLDVKKGLKDFFGFDRFREYAGEPLQEKAADLAVKRKSILVLFPTGGGKSIAFQVPALMSGENENGLTVVISPLQSLMKDQVDNLRKDGIRNAFTINGLLDPIERKYVIEKIRDGSAYMLYIAPESLRSNTIERLLLERNIVRFVIDEAHCFSAWGQNFRPDYLYIADFIKKLQEEKNCESIPVSCFTATAKPEVRDDIRKYFNEKLGLDLETIEAKSVRENLAYKIIKVETESDKNAKLRDIIEGKKCPIIIYVSRTKTAEKLAKRLNEYGFKAEPFYGKMKKEEKIKNQNDFMQGFVQIIVATNAFGMGVDKKNVGLVVHYDISDSLENYLQEAGRAGRDENIKADCYVLFDEDDLDKHFLMLNGTKLNITEIKQIWEKAIRNLVKNGNPFYKSALEIARKAGWDDSKRDIETKVITAINALEQVGYIKRKNNSPRVFANSITPKTMQEISQKIDLSKKITSEEQKITAKRIMKSLFSSKVKQKMEEKAEERIDYIADILGLKIEDVREMIYILLEEQILSNATDILVSIDGKRKVNNILKEFFDLEKSLINQIIEQEKTLNIKELNEYVNSTPVKIKAIFNFLIDLHLIEGRVSGNEINIRHRQSKQELENNLSKRKLISDFVIKFLYKIEKDNRASFSILELRNAFNAENLFKTEIGINDIENTLLYLSKIEALNIEDGFFVIYNKLSIERLENDNRKEYTKSDYGKLEEFYKNKTKQIHIVGEYAKKRLIDEQEALKFVKDYFNLDSKKFLNTYFDKKQQENIERNISVSKYNELIDSLSVKQQEIIDSEANCIVVAAGPGSGKTRVLVNKLASLLTMENVKTDQLLMLTYSRAAANEFKKRLIGLIGEAAYHVEIKTFHSYCFDLLGKKGSSEKFETVIGTVVEKIKNDEIELSRITKDCLVLDEAQDMRAEDFELVKILRAKNKDMRIIAVGDDDQGIYEWNNSDSKYFASLLEEENSIKYELLENYRSKANIVNFANDFVKEISNRMKAEPIQAVQKENGKIKIVECKSKNVVWSVVRDILENPPIGSTCVLANTNDDVLKIAGMLSQSEITVKIIQTKKDSSIYNLLNILELRYFYDSLGENTTILEDIWEKAKEELDNKFKNTKGLEVTKNIIRKFEEINPQTKYKTDFKEFIKDSDLEYSMGNASDNPILVSTIHQAKGKEFDNVFIMLNPDSYYDYEDMENKSEKIRTLYVALTRAKNLLHIHFHGINVFKKIINKEHGIKRVFDNEDYPPVNKMSMLLVQTDVKLGYFRDKQKEIEKLNGNDNLSQNDLFKFSDAFIEEKKKLETKGYNIEKINVNFIVYWRDKKTKEEIKIILPRVDFVGQE